MCGIGKFPLYKFVACLSQCFFYDANSSLHGWVRHNEVVPFVYSDCEGSSFNEIDMFMTPWNFDTFRVMEPWLSLQYRREKIANVRDRMGNWTNNYYQV